MKRVLVVGDACVDHLLLNDEYIPPIDRSTRRCNWEIFRKSSLQQGPGGVLLLAEFLKKGLKETQVKCLNGDKIGQTNDHLVSSIAEVREGIEQKVYRIHDFKGFNGPDQESLKVPISSARTSIKGAELLIIDDAGNGLRKQESFPWLDKISENTQKPVVIHKISRPLKNNPLLDKVNQLAGDRHVVLLDAKDIRRTGILLSSKLSWDKTFEDFIHSYKKDSRFNVFRKCDHLIIRFGLEGILYIRKTKTKRKDQLAIPGCDIRAVYQSDLFEGQIDSQVEGSMQGMSYTFLTALTQSFISHSKSKNSSFPDLIQKDQLQEMINEGLENAMRAASNCLFEGFSKNAKGQLNYQVSKYLTTQISNDLINDLGFDPKDFQIDSIDLNAFYPDQKENNSLLADQLSGGYPNMIYGALEIARSGKILGSMTTVPFVKFGKLISADREEIERYRSVRSLLSDYLADHSKTTPISIGVFGPPGSGKSFGVKQIAEMFKGRFTVLEFNLSQFNTIEELSRAFHAVRDIGLGNKMPLVFFDEFDSNFGEKKLGWLKYFLAPMQDGEFHDGHKIHPIGRAVFVFAGGTKYTYKEFEHPFGDQETGGNKRQSPKNIDEINERKQRKVPDFLSRLRGYIDIKGVNRQPSNNPNHKEHDAVYLVRRALVLYHLLSQVQGLKNRENNEISIDPDLLRALVTTERLEHGARSLASVIGMSDLDGARTYSRSHLPMEHLLETHLDSEQFKKILDVGIAYKNDVELLEKYGQLAHKYYVVSEKKKGLTLKENSALVPWEKLSEHDRESNRQQGADALFKLSVFGYDIRPKKGRGKKSAFNFPPEEQEQLAIMEHERWLIMKQKAGWKYAPDVKNNKNKTNPNILAWGDLEEVEKEKDRESIINIPRILEQCGFEIYKPKKQPPIKD